MSELILSKKQQYQFWWWVNPKYRIICNVGPIRTGKTFSGAKGFTIWSMTQFNDKYFLVIGKDKPTILRNVIENILREAKDDGFNISHNQRRSFYTLEYIHPTKGHVKNTYYYFGSDREGLDSNLRGVTAHGILSDETSTAIEPVFDQALGRLFSTWKDGAKCWIYTNADHPDHWLLNEFIKKADKRRVKVLNWTFKDNPGLTDEEVKDAMTLWDEDSIFYKRYILNQWIAADGVIFTCWNREIHTVDPIDESGITSYFCSLDYGLDHPFVVGLWGYHHKEDVHYLLDCIYFDPQKDGEYDDEQYCKLIKSLVNGRNIEFIIAPHDARSLKNMLKNKTDYVVRDAKNDVINGLSEMISAMKSGKVKFCRTHNNEKGFIEFGKYVWDKVASRFNGKDTPLKRWDDWICMCRYYIHTRGFMKFN